MTEATPPSHGAVALPKNSWEALEKLLPVVVDVAVRLLENQKAKATPANNGKGGTTTAPEPSPASDQASTGKQAAQQETAQPSSPTVTVGQVADQVAAAFGINDLDAFTLNKLEELLNKGMGDALDENQNAQEISRVLVAFCTPVVKALMDFLREGKANPHDLANQLDSVLENDGEALEQALMQSWGISQEVAGVLKGLRGRYTLAFLCFACTYKIYRKAAQDAALAKEHRLEAERLAEQTMEQIAKLRAEWEKELGAFLLERLIPFQEALDAMDQVAGNDQAFVEANAALQRRFGHKMQFGTVREFDDLMESDEALKL